MTGAESIFGLKRIWQGLLVQLVCQALLVVGVVAGDVVLSWTGNSGLAEGISIVMTTAPFVAEIVAWVEISVVLGRFKDASTRFVSASRWYLLSICLVFAHFVFQSLSGALQESGVAVTTIQGAAGTIVQLLKFVVPLVALWMLVEGFIDYLDSLGESPAQLRSFRRVRAFVAAIVVIELVLSLALFVLSALAPSSAVFAALSLMLVVTYVAGFCAQAAAVAKARSAARTVEEVLE